MYASNSSAGKCSAEKCTGSSERLAHVWAAPVGIFYGLTCCYHMGLAVKGDGERPVVDDVGLALLAMD
jgi:hypothetical protein